MKTTHTNNRDNTNTYNIKVWDCFWGSGLFHLRNGEHSYNDDFTRRYKEFSRCANAFNVRPRGVMDYLKECN